MGQEAGHRDHPRHSRFTALLRTVIKEHGARADKFVIQSITNENCVDFRNG